MKKVLIIMMILILFLSAAGCGSEGRGGNEGTPEGAGENSGEAAAQGAGEDASEYVEGTGFLMPDCVCGVDSTSSEGIGHEMYDVWYVIRYDDPDTCTDAYLEYEEYLGENFTRSGEQEYTDSQGNTLLLAARMTDMYEYFGFGITYAQ